MTPSAAIAAVCAHEGLTRAAILGQRRDAPLVLARQAAMWLARSKPKRSYLRIGRAFKRDHTTVHHGVRRIAREMEADPVFAAAMERMGAA